jgi:hypothetical protein
MDPDRYRLIMPALWRIAVVDPVLEMRRLAGKLALLLAGVYVLLLVGVVAGVSAGARIPLLEWLLLLVPAVPFVPSVLDALRLHRTSDPARLKMLWPRCLLLAVIGTALMFAAALMSERMNRG